ncbi:MAG: peptidylprolyl isomerase [Clostridia bacterium]|nr:peptidylprolyl isomerase [Clostridia bacterium]
MNVFKKVTALIVSIVMGVILMAGFSGCKKDETISYVPENESDPIVTMVIKGYGTVIIELFPDVAPITVSSFVTLANSGYYDGLIFHRVIKNFMIQGGDKEGTGSGLAPYNIKGEFGANGFKNDLKHVPGVISMARGKSMDSAGTQFFICVADCDWLDGQYAAFGRVLAGMDHVYAVSKVATDRYDRPVEKVVIDSVRVDTKGVDYSNFEKIGG